jgi:hypothetical protein
MNWRETREAELRRLRESNPVKLLALYRNLTGLGVDSPLPHGVTIRGMIAELLDDEERRTHFVVQRNEMTK